MKTQCNDKVTKKIENYLKVRTPKNLKLGKEWKTAVPVQWNNAAREIPENITTNSTED